MRSLDLRLLTEALSVCRLPPGTPVPTASSSGLWTATRTDDEVSVVCATGHEPDGARIEAGWRALVIVGPLEFELTGVLVSVAAPLAGAEVPIFAISTFDTDYVLVRQDHLERAVAVLTAAGHALI